MSVSEDDPYEQLRGDIEELYQDFINNTDVEAVTAARYIHDIGEELSFQTYITTRTIEESSQVESESTEA